MYASCPRRAFALPERPRIQSSRFRGVEALPGPEARRNRWRPRRPRPRAPRRPGRRRSRTCCPWPSRSTPTRSPSGTRTSRRASGSTSPTPSWARSSRRSRSACRSSASTAATRSGSSPTRGPSGPTPTSRILCAGATVVPIYQTNSPEECHYVLDHSESMAVILEDQSQLDKIRKVRDELPKLEHVISMEPLDGDDVISLDELREKGREPLRRGLQAAHRLGRALRRRDLHLHVGHHRAAQGLRDRPPELARHARHGAERRTC